MVLKVCRN